MISVIIPTYNEAAQIKDTIRRLWEYDPAGLIREIIVSDGGSRDDTVEIALAEGVQAMISPQKGRAAQMNFGAANASSPLLYFLHADTVPPRNFTQQIAQAYKQGFKSGCFRLRFDYRHWFLQANCWFTRFDVNHFRFGDQSLFVTKDVFQKVAGFRQDHIVLEDQEIIPRIKQHTRFAVLPGAVTTSARKYTTNGIYKTQAVYFLIYLMYQLGYPQQKLVRTYRSLIRQDKL